MNAWPSIICLEYSLADDKRQIEFGPSGNGSGTGSGSGSGSDGGSGGGSSSDSDAGRRMYGRGTYRSFYVVDDNYAIVMSYMIIMYMLCRT